MGAGELYELYHVAEQALLDQHLRHHVAEVEQILLAEHRLHIIESDKGCVLLMALQDEHLIVERGIAYHYLHHETVYLRLGQLVGAFLLHGVLRGDDREEGTHGMGDAVDGGLALLHHLKEGGLCLGRCAVYLVDEHEVGEDRSGVEVELRRLHVEHRGAEHIARHEVGGELQAAEAGVDEPREEAGQQGLGHTGHTLEQHMAVGQDGGEEHVDSAVLPHYHLVDRLSELDNLLGEGGEVHSQLGILFHIVRVFTFVFRLLSEAQRPVCRQRVSR